MKLILMQELPRRERKLAGNRLSNEAQGQTLQATELFHEGYLRLVDGDRAQQWNGRGHFFAAAAKAMRRILVERSRQKKSYKRGGDLQRQQLSLDELLEPAKSVDLELDEGLVCVLAFCQTTNSHRFVTPERRCLLGDQPNIHLQVARLPIQPTRWGTLRKCLPVPCRRSTSSVAEPIP